MQPASPFRDVPEWIEVDAPRSLRRTLGQFRNGFGDPTTRLGDGTFVRATYTPDGPGTLRLTWTADPAPVDHCDVRSEAWGPGSDWLLARVDAITGRTDRPVAFPNAHPAVGACTARSHDSPESALLTVPIISCSRRSSPNGSPPARRFASGHGCAAGSANRPRADRGDRRIAAATLPRQPAPPSGVVVPSARHRGQAGPHARRDRPPRRQSSGVGPRQDRRCSPRNWP